jgi:hypothetical protein
MTTVVVYKTGPQGPAGPPGPSGGAAGSMSRTAAVDVGGFKVVRELGDGTVTLASSDDPSHAKMIVGVTLGAAAQGATVGVVRQGEIVDGSMGLTPGPLFLGINGAIVSAAPSSGALVQIGVAATSGRAVIDVQSPIIRG